MHRPAVTALFWIAATLPVVVAREAHAACPEAGLPNDPVCEPDAAMFRPGALAATYIPRGDGTGSFVGGGASISLFDWAIHRSAGGPGFGRIAADLAVLTDVELGSRKAFAWRFGPSLSFESNPSRRFVIPFYAVHLGGLSVERAGGHRAFVDGGLGVALVRTHAFLVDLEGTYAVPFASTATWAGFRGQLTASIGWM